MTKRTRNSIDGFIPRRPGSQLGDLHQKEVERPIDRSLHTGDTNGDVVGTPRERKIIGRSDIDDSLREIDDPYSDQKKGRKGRKAQKKRDKKANKRPKNKVARIIKWVVTLLVVFALAVGGYLVFKAINASDSVFNGNIFDLSRTEPLKQDDNGRSNFLIVGTSEDDPGHEAAYLTDSILILSVNQTTKDAYTFSVPRDLYVRYGTACLPGYSGKINSYYSCVNEGTDAASEQERLVKTQAFIGEILGLDLQYGVKVNYTVMRDVVNAIGGSITVTIESRDPNGQMDSNFDWKCGPNIAKRKVVCPPNGHFIDYPNGPAVLDAEHALYLAQARGDRAPTYGFEQSNFDRERNQQKILVAIRDKAMQAGTLTNLGAVTGLIDALGKNLRTDIATKEIRTLMKLAQDIPSDKIISVDLYKEGEAQFTTRTIEGAGSVVLPAAGQYDYSELQAYIKKMIAQEPYMKESPHVTVLNGSETAGMAQVEADALEAIGFIVDKVDNAPEGKYSAYTIYQIATDKPLTAAKLKAKYGGTLKTTSPPVSVVGDTDFLIIVGPKQ